MKKKHYTVEEVFARLRKRSKDIESGKIKLKPIQRIEATEFVRGQISDKMLKYLGTIIKDATDILNLYPQDCPQGLYPFSRIVPLYNGIYSKFDCRIVKITSKNAKYLKSDYVARRDDEIPYLKRWFPKNAPVKGVKSDHVDVILYNKEQLAKEGTPIKSDWGIVCINVELKERTPLSPTTMINNQMGIMFGGNGEILNVKDYNKSVEFWKNHALMEK
jgi:hypothetical protein